MITAQRAERLTVRAATADDVVPLVRLRAVAARRAYAGLGADAIDRWLAVRGTAGHVRSLLDRPDGLLLVATEDGRHRGMGYVRAARSEAWLSDLYCAAAGRGVGSCLLEARLQWAREQGARVARCNVFAQNIAALHFFRRRGFVVVGTETSDVIPGALLLRHERRVT